MSVTRIVTRFFKLMKSRKDSPGPFVFSEARTVIIVLLFALGFLLSGQSLFAASSAPALGKAKKGAEAKT